MFFFLWQQRVRSGWTHVTDLSVDLNEFLMQDLELAELSDLSFDLSRCGLVRHGFRDSLAIDLEGQPEIGAVAWIIGLMATTVRLAASAPSRSHGASTQVTESCDLIGDVGALLLQGP